MNSKWDLPILTYVLLPTVSFDQEREVAGVHSVVRDLYLTVYEHTALTHAIQISHYY